MANLVLDLHEISHRSDQLDREPNRMVQEVMTKRIALVEIIPGNGSGHRKKRVLRFLNHGHIRALDHRIEKDDRNVGRIFIHVRHELRRPREEPSCTGWGTPTEDDLRAAFEDARRVR